MIGPEKVGCRSVMSSSSSSKKVLVCCRVAIRVRTGMLTDATGETCEALVTGEEAGVSLGGVCTGFTCTEQREERKKEIKGSAILKKEKKKIWLLILNCLTSCSHCVITQYHINMTI